MTKWVAAAVLAAGPLALPALADDDEQAKGGSLFDQRVSMEWQTWNWVGTGSGAGSLGYSAPMTVFTVTDRSGVLLGAASNVASNEARRREAEREAIKNDKRVYEWRVEEAHALEGTRFSFTVGMGGVNGLFANGGASGMGSASGAQAKMARLDLEGDIVSFGGGALVFQTGTASYSAFVPGATVTNNSFNLGAFDWPLGLAYRWTPPFLPGLVIQPAANFNWLWAAYRGLNPGSGGPWDAHTMGVDVGYYLLPNLKVRGSYYLDRLPHDKLGWMQEGDMADLKAANVGLMMTF